MFGFLKPLLKPALKIGAGLLGINSDKDGTAGKIGNAIAGAAGGAMTYAQWKEEQDRLKAQNLASFGADANRRIQNQPLRDKLMAIMSGRAGMAPGQFRPADNFNPQLAGPGGPSLGGIDMAAAQQQIAGYRPGDGGTSTTFDKEVLKRLGYG